jgi:AraC family transcriptional activator of tynA and feaB
MRVLVSTKTVHPRDRFAYWREEACKLFVRHEFTSSLGRNFHGEIAVASLGNINLATYRGDPCTAIRTTQSLRGTLDDDVILCRQTAGQVNLQQDGRHTTAGPGDLFMLDPRRPFVLDGVSKAEGIFLKITRAELEARLGEVSTYTATPLCKVHPTASLASAYIAALTQHAEALDPSIGSKLGRQALDLVALAFQSMSGGIAQLSSTRATTLLRLKTIIEGRLHDPTLKPAMVADAAGISVRYANALLATEGTSLERFIMYRRLLRSRQFLESPAQAGRTISEIAFTCGFSDLSHFSRRFKAEFGGSPSEIRPPAF